MAATPPVPLPPRPGAARFAYSPRIADMWRILSEIQTDLVHEGNQTLLGQIQDLVAVMEMRDKELEDFLTPYYRSKVVSDDNSQLTVASGTWLTVPFAAVDYDIFGSFGTVAPYSTYTAPVSGYYNVAAMTQFTAFASNNVGARFLVNNTPDGDGTFAPAFAGSRNNVLASNPSLYMNQGDQLVFQILQDSGVNELTNFATRARNWFSVHINSQQVYS